MTRHYLDPTDSNMAAPLLAKSFGNIQFAVICAIAFTTVLGTVSGLIMAASGAVAHDLMTNFLKIKMTDHQKVLAGKVVAVIVGIIAMWLGVAFKEFNVGFLVGWAFNVAASANLPALVMLLFWPKTTKAGITAAISIGLVSSLGRASCSAIQPMPTPIPSQLCQDGFGCSLQPAGDRHDSLGVHRARCRLLITQPRKVSTGRQIRESVAVVQGGTIATE